MTGELIPSGSSIRVLPSEIGSVVPVVDIANLITYSPDHLTKKIRENPDIFKGRQVLTDLPTSGGMQRCVCVDRVGFDRLLLLLKPAKTRDIFERIEEFRIKAFEKMETPKEIALIPASPDIRAELQEARELAAICGKSVELFQAVILRKHGKTELADALTPSLVHGESGWYTPTRLIETFMRHDPTLTPKRLNQYLSNTRENGVWAPFQYRDENHIWRLAPRGIPHGKEKMYEVPDTGHKEIRILWKESVLVAAGLKRPEL